MKKARLSVLFILALCTLAFNACKNEITDFNSLNFLSVKIDGVEENSSTTAAILTSGNLQVISKLNGSDEVISLGINKARVGSFDVVNDALLLSYTTNSTYASTYLGLAGTVTITAMTSSSVSGTFQFAGTDSKTGETKVITEGLFKCKL